MLFYGDYIRKRDNKVFKDSLISSSFTAWQILSAQSEMKIPWDKYLKKLGLINSKKVTKEEALQETDDILRNVEELINNGKRNI